MLDEGLLIKSDKEISVEFNPKYPDEVRSKRYMPWEYRVRGEYFYPRPYFDDYMKFLARMSLDSADPLPVNDETNLSRNRHKIKLHVCVNAERKRAVGLVF